MDTQEAAVTSNAKKILQIAATVLSILLSISAAACCAVAVRSGSISDRYISVSPLITAFWATFIASFAISIVLVFFLKSERFGSFPVAVRLFSVLPAAASLYMTWTVFTGEDSQWLAAEVICLLISTAFFVLKIFNGNELFKIISGIGVFALAAVIVASLYLDLSIEINSPFKLLVQFGAAALIAGTSADIRHSLSRITEGGFLLLKLCAAAMCTVCAAAVLTAFAKEPSLLPPVYAASSILFAGYAISSYAEVISRTASSVMSIYNKMKGIC